MKTITEAMHEIEDVKIKEETEEQVRIENTATKTFNFTAMKEAPDIKSFSVEKTAVTGTGNLEAILKEV